MRRLFLILLAAALVAVLLFLFVFSGRSGGTNVILADLWSKVPQVIYQQGTGPTAIVLASTAQVIHRGDKISVDDRGEAELRFPDDRLIVRVFRNSELALDFQGISVDDESKVDSFGVRRGAVFAYFSRRRAHIWSSGSILYFYWTGRARGDCFPSGRYLGYNSNRDTARKRRKKSRGTY